MDGRVKVSTYFTGKIEVLQRGAMAGAMLLLVMRQRGVLFPWLLIVVLGMVIAMKMLILCVMCQAGLVRPWKR
jgi:hypothetical protein